MSKSSPPPRRTWRDRVASLAEAALTPLEIDDVLDMFHPLRKGGDLRGRIVSVQSETANAATLLIEPGRDWTGHVPGQYLRLGVDVDGVRLWRSYSLTHGPRPDRRISITVKAVPDGAVSNHLVHRVRPGDFVHLDQAAGDFVLSDPMPTKLLLITAGSGITPVIGMLRNLYSRATPPGLDVVLIHSAMARPETLFGRELRSLNNRGLIRLLERHTATDGRIDVEELPALVPDLADRTTYACGPAGLLDALEEYHAHKGLTLHTERFRPVVLTGGGEGGEVTFDRNGTTVDADGQTPILDAAEQAGVLMPSGCRMGICFGCVLPMREGVVRDLRTGALTTAAPGETDAGGIPIQTCISAAAGPCRIDH